MKYLLLFTLLVFGSYQVLAQNESTVTSLTLVNAETNEPVGELMDGAVINFVELGTDKLSVIANTSPDQVGSLVFSFDDNPSYQVENLAPYTIAGDDTQNGAMTYGAWTLSVGEHTLTATPYSEGDSQGTAGTPLTVRFTVVDEAQAATEPATGSEATAPQTEAAPVESSSGEGSVEQPMPASATTARLREERFEVLPEATSTLRGSVLVADYGLDQVILTVLVSGASAVESYPIALSEGGCDGRGGEAPAFDPIDGRTGLNATAVSLSYNEILDGNHYFAIYSPTTGQENILSCTLLGR